MYREENIQQLKKTWKCVVISKSCCSYTCVSFYDIASKIIWSVSFQVVSKAWNYACDREYKISHSFVLEQVRMIFKISIFLVILVTFCFIIQLEKLLKNNIVFIFIFDRFM